MSKSLAQRFWAKVDKRGHDECWPWTAATDACGYGKLYRARVAGRQVLVGAHRAAWEIAQGEPPPAELVVRHRCDNPRCCNPDHLELGTHKDNAHDRIRRGRNVPPRGRRNVNTKLTEGDVIQIRAMSAAGFTQPEIGKRFGVDRTTVSAILRGKTWSYV